ncbi:hypothetical protein DYU11_20955 [Fibrisoma montanum]|uniref:Uncharacterized protein n=1 Tax=Fibrisoma montanum TaxID=2305895 RepID=A0A418M3X7_9BACT|nr:hypothetical protein [Fibrisoma montanum]RIV20517.1 hypothetical protein DYU11_20955 [Fibrisoma montanum]
MKKLLIILLLLAGNSFAQTELKGWTGYRGNPFDRVITLMGTDTAATVSVSAYQENKAALLAPTDQPSVSKTGKQLLIRWANTIALPDQSWIEIRMGSTVRYAGWLLISKDPKSFVAPPSSNLTKFFTLENVASGHVLPHSGASRLLVGDCYPSDRSTADPLWRVEAFDDNTCVLRGPPSETFSGTVVVTVYKKLSN